jgi:hypothetical protein
VKGQPAKDERALHVVKADQQEGKKTRPLRSARLPDAPGCTPASSRTGENGSGSRGTGHPPRSS